jgi:excisionase family DNA binding protein
VLTTQQAAEKLGITRQRVGALIRSGRLPAVKVGRDWVLDEKDVDNFEKQPAGRPKMTQKVVANEDIEIRVDLERPNSQIKYRLTTADMDWVGTPFQRADCLTGADALDLVDDWLESQG